MAPKSKIGQVYGRLHVINHYGKNEKGRHSWLCKCICGNEKIVSGSDLVTGKVKSCGCLKKEKTKLLGINSKKHGLSHTRLHRIWSSAKQRCFYTKHIAYKNYGGKGVTMCEEWKKDFVSFYNWSIQNGYNERLTLDRIDISGNYEPSNCRWITYKKQENNRSNNSFVYYEGNRYTISELADILKISQACLNWRLKNGWSEKELKIKPNFANKKIRKEVV